MKLYELTEEIKAVQKMVEDDELTEEMVADTMEALGVQFKDKAEAVMKVRQGLIADAEAIKREKERLAGLQAAKEKKAEWLKDYVRRNMESLGQDKLDLGVFKLTLKEPVKKLGDIDESKVPDEFFTIVPETKNLDRRSLLAVAKEIDIDGVELVDGLRALLIK